MNVIETEIGGVKIIEPDVLVMSAGGLARLTMLSGIERSGVVLD